MTYTLSNQIAFFSRTWIPLLWFHRFRMKPVITSFFIFLFLRGSVQLNDKSVEKNFKKDNKNFHSMTIPFNIYFQICLEKKENDTSLYYNL